MINKTHVIVYAYGLIMLLLAGCEKPEGLGGNSSIKGKVTVHAYDNSFTTLQDAYPATDENIFLKLDGENVILDETSTSHEGYFKFNYLTKGEYSLIVYSDTLNNTGTNDEIAVITPIEIKDNNTDNDVGEIIIYKSLDFDDGHATISGTVYQENWTKDFFFVIDTTKAQELDVYLFYNGGNAYVERIRTNHNGYFAFNNLIKGNYQVLVYSEDTNLGIELIPVITNVSITSVNQNKNIGNIYIAKEK